MKDLKAWCQWKKAEPDVLPEELLLVKDVEDLISQVGTYKSAFEKCLNEKFFIQEELIELRGRIITALKKEEYDANAT